MSGNAEVTLMGRGLCVVVEGRKWFIMLKRTDLCSDDRFFELNSSNVGSSIVSQFLPNWKQLQWEHPKVEHLSSESFAQDGEYRVNLIYPADGTISPEQVEREFLEYMSATG